MTPERWAWVFVAAFAEVAGFGAGIALAGHTWLAPATGLMMLLGACVLILTLVRWGIDHDRAEGE